MRYRPELDGLRALAVLAVFAAHTGYPLTAGGWMGVDVFFVLSGYLITSLLVNESRRTGHVRLRAFYLRRVLRLYPALLVMLAVGAFFYRDLGDEGTVTGYLRACAVSALYVEDLVFGLAHHPVGGFGHTWTLGVEEQFYLLWPFAYLLLVKRRLEPFWWALGGTVISFGLLVALTARSPDGVPATYYLPWTRMATILSGCALALFLTRHRAPSLLTRRGAGPLVVITMIALVIIADSADRYPHLRWEAPAIAVSTVALIAHLDGRQSMIKRALGVRPLAFLGRRSYGFYLYYEPVIIVVSANLHHGRLVAVAVELALTLALCVVSYRFVELPFLRLKSRYVLAPAV